MRRVAIVTRIFSNQGGLEHYTHRLVEGILSLDYQVTIICEENHSKLQHQLLRVCQFKRPDKVLSKSERLKYYLRETTAVVKREGPFEVVHSQHFPTENPDVVTFHNHTVARLTQSGKGWENLVNALKARYRSSYKVRDKCDYLLATQSRILIFPSVVMRRDFQEHFALPQSANTASHLVAYPGVDHNESEVPKDETTVTFVFVGRGYRKKGLDVLLSACRKLVGRGYDFRLIIAGLESKLPDQIRLMFMGLQSYVHYLGFVSSMADVYAKANAIILPSRVEPFGMAPLEAMSHGIVPIVSSVCGVSEILTEGHDALILQNQLDADELANLMASLIDQPVLRNSLARQAKLTAAKCSWQNTTEVTVAAYENTIASKNIQYAEQSRQAKSELLAKN